MKITAIKLQASDRDYANREIQRLEERDFQRFTTFQFRQTDIVAL